MNPNSASPERPETPPQNAARRLTRRQVIFGTIGAAVVVGAAIPTAFALNDKHVETAIPVPREPSQTPNPGHPAGGKLVAPLLAAHPFYAAHRGGSLDWPEMSLEGYRNSVAAGVDAVEMSLARTSDGVWFGLHDATLDRTSGTTGFVASEHTWAEVKRHKITAKLSLNHSQAVQPYLRFDTLVEAYGDTHTIFVDPKSARSENYPELLALMAKLVEKPSATFIAKGYCTGVKWAAAASDAGLTTWGFYYGSELETRPELLDSTKDAWSLLGLDYEASDAIWKRIREQGKPVIGHIIPSKSAEKRALDEGAQGLMISGVAQILG